MTESSEPRAPAAPTTTRWGIVVLATLAGMLGAMQIGKVAPALPLIREELGIGMITAGWVASVIMLTGATTATAIGVIADRLGYRRILMIGILALIAGSVLGGLSDSVGPLLLSRFIEGIGYIAIVVAGTPIIAQVCTPQAMRLAMGIWSTYFSTGIAAMIALSPLFLEAFGWRTMWFANAALSTGFLVLFYFVMRASAVGAVPPREQRQSWRHVRRTVTLPGPWLMTGIFFLLSLATFSIATWLPTFLIENTGRSPTAAALITALFMALFVPSNILGGWLLQVGVARWQLLAVSAVAFGALPLGVFAAELAETWRLLCAAGFALIAGLIPGAVFAGIPAHAPTPDQAGAVTGVILQGSNFGLLCGPPVLAALVLRLGGWGESSWLYLILGAVGLVIALGLRRVERTPQ